MPVSTGPPLSLTVPDPYGVTNWDDRPNWYTINTWVQNVAVWRSEPAPSPQAGSLALQGSGRFGQDPSQIGLYLGGHQRWVTHNQHDVGLQHQAARNIYAGTTVTVGLPSESAVLDTNDLLFSGPGPKKILPLDGSGSLELGSGGNTRVWITPPGLVGVGTDDPKEIVDAAGSVRARAHLEAPNQTAPASDGGLALNAWYWAGGGAVWRRRYEGQYPLHLGVGMHGLDYFELNVAAQGVADSNIDGGHWYPFLKFHMGYPATNPVLPMLYGSPVGRVGIQAASEGELVGRLDIREALDPTEQETKSSLWIGNNSVSGLGIYTDSQGKVFYFAKYQGDFNTPEGVASGHYFSTPGGIWLNPGSETYTGDVYPARTLAINLGSPSLEFLSFWVGEMHVRKLIVEEERLTKDARIRIAPGDRLVHDITDDQSYIDVEGGAFLTNDIIELRGQQPNRAPKLEFMKATTDGEQMSEVDPVSGATINFWRYNVERGSSGSNSMGFPLDPWPWLKGDALANTGSFASIPTMGWWDMYALFGMTGIPPSDIYTHDGAAWDMTNHAGERGLLMYGNGSGTSAYKAGGAMYFGSPANYFSTIQFDLEIPGNATTITIVPEYYRSDATWQPLSGVVVNLNGARWLDPPDNTVPQPLDLKSTGWWQIDWTPPGDWIKTTLGGLSILGRYWIRLRIDAISPAGPTQPPKLTSRNHIFITRMTYGPSQALLVRYGNGFNQFAEHFVAGNLRGYYGYAQNVWGFAAGPYINGVRGVWVTANAADGIKILEKSVTNADTTYFHALSTTSSFVDALGDEPEFQPGTVIIGQSSGGVPVVGKNAIIIDPTYGITLYRHTLPFVRLTMNGDFALGRQHIHETIIEGQDGYPLLFMNTSALNGQSRGMFFYRDHTQPATISMWFNAQGAGQPTPFNQVMEVRGPAYFPPGSGIFSFTGNNEGGASWGSEVAQLAKGWKIYSSGGVGLFEGWGGGYKSFWSDTNGKWYFGGKSDGFGGSTASVRADTRGITFMDIPESLIRGILSNRGAIKWWHVDEGAETDGAYPTMALHTYAIQNYAGGGNRITLGYWTANEGKTSPGSKIQALHYSSFSTNSFGGWVSYAGPNLTAELGGQGESLGTGYFNIYFGQYLRAVHLNQSSGAHTTVGFFHQSGLVIGGHTGNTTPAATLHVIGSGLFSGNVEIGGTLTVPGDIIVTGSGEGAVSFEDITVNGIAYLQSVIIYEHTRIKPSKAIKWETLTTGQEFWMVVESETWKFQNNDGTPIVGMTFDRDTMAATIKALTINDGLLNNKAIPGGTSAFMDLSSVQTASGKTLNSPTINNATTSGGTINNAVIGGSVPAAATITTLTVIGAAQLDSTLNVNGAVTLGSTLNGNTIPAVTGDIFAMLARTQTFTGQNTFSNATAPIIVAKIGPTSARQHILPDVLSDVVALLTATQSMTNKSHTSSTIDSSPIGDTFRSSGKFTTLSANDATTLTSTLNVSGVTTLTNDLLMQTSGEYLIFGTATNWPTFSTRSIGTRVVFYPFVGASSADYAAGIAGSTLWFSVPTVTESFQWYGGTTLGMTLTGAGALTLVGHAQLNSTLGVVGVATFTNDVMMQTSGEFLIFGTALAAPSVSTRSIGTRIVLNPSLTGSVVDYAIGVNTSTLWQSVPTGGSFRWYGNTSLVSTLTSTGDFDTVGWGAFKDLFLYGTGLTEWASLQYDATNDRLNLDRTLQITAPANHLLITLNSNAKSRMTVDSDGSLILSTTANGNLDSPGWGGSASAHIRLRAPQDIYLAPGIANTGQIGALLPTQSYRTSIGSADLKFLEMWVTQINTEYLVAHEKLATMGGRLIVGMGNVLTQPVETTHTQIFLKVPDFVQGEFIFFEGKTSLGLPKFECMKINSTYTVITTTDPNDSTRTITEYRYDVLRGTLITAYPLLKQTWAIGDACFSTGRATNDGFHDIFAMRSFAGVPHEYIFAANASVGFGPNLAGTKGHYLFNGTDGDEVNDAVYFGNTNGTWAGIFADFETAGNFSGRTIVYEYWNGSSWTSLIGHTVDNPTFATGYYAVNWTPASQTGWAPTTINGVLAYWVRSRISAFTSGTTGAKLNANRYVTWSFGHQGPSHMIWHRYGSIWNEIRPNYNAGRLTGSFGYGSGSYVQGIAFGEYPETGTGVWVTANTQDGFRITERTGGSNFTRYNVLAAPVSWTAWPSLSKTFPVGTVLIGQSAAGAPVAGKSVFSIEDTYGLNLWYDTASIFQIYAGTDGDFAVGDLRVGYFGNGQAHIKLDASDGSFSIRRKRSDTGAVEAVHTFYSAVQADGTGAQLELPIRFASAAGGFLSSTGTWASPTTGFKMYTESGLARLEYYVAGTMLTQISTPGGSNGNGIRFFNQSTTYAPGAWWYNALASNQGVAGAFAVSSITGLYQGQFVANFDVARSSGVVTLQAIGKPDGTNREDSFLHVVSSNGTGGWPAGDYVTIGGATAFDGLMVGDTVTKPVAMLDVLQQTGLTYAGFGSHAAIARFRNTNASYHGYIFIESPTSTQSAISFNEGGTQKAVSYWWNSNYRLFTGADRLVLDDTGNMGLPLSSGATPSYGGGTGVIWIGNRSTAPSTNPANGYVMYAESGGLKGRGGSGTVSTIGVADPHCPRCGRDYALEWENEKFGGKFSLCVPCLVSALEKAGVPFSDYAIAQPITSA